MKIGDVVTVFGHIGVVDDITIDHVGGVWLLIATASSRQFLIDLDELDYGKNKAITL